MATGAMGKRMAAYRRRGGIRQAALAGLVGRRECWLSQVERTSVQLTTRDAGPPPALRLPRSRLTLSWRTMSKRSLADSHGQSGILLTLMPVRSRRHSYHSQADSAGSIPVTRSTREKCCKTSKSAANAPLEPTLGGTRIGPPCH
jgi:hypothetical protein